MRQTEKIENILRVQGIKARGFGTFPKVVVRDPSISVYAKALYGYFCSLAGRGDTAFPCRDTILRSLRVSRDVYYAAMRELTSHGYIEVEKEDRPEGSTRFTRNIYTIVARPSRYSNTDDLDEKAAKLYLEVARHGLDVHGYGIVPYIVMSDQRIKSVDKAVYIYISTIAGSRGYVDLDLRRMCHDLNFQNIQRAQRHVKNLRELGYITAVQLHINGRFSTGRYYINATPDMEAECPRVECLTPATPKAVLTMETSNDEDDELINCASAEAENMAAMSHASEREFENRYTDAESSVDGSFMENMQETENRYTAQNAEPQKEVHGIAAHPKSDPAKQVHITETVTTSNNSTINNTLNSMIDRWIPQVRKKICYNLLTASFGSANELEALDDLVRAASEAMATTNMRIQVGGQPMLTEHVREVLERMTCDAAFHVIERFLCRQDRVAAVNRKQYLLCSLYREILSPTPPAEDADDF